MTIYTDGPRLGNPPTIRELWADNLTQNVSLVTEATKVVAICAVIAFALWLLIRLFSPKGGRLGQLITLWIDAKERDLKDRKTSR